MRFYTFMPIGLKPFYDEEMEKCQVYFSLGELKTAWNHLERAHIIGQRYPFAHSYVHWKMLLFGLRVKSYREIIGQLPRLAFGGVKSFVGVVPVGNPGGSDVPALKSFPLESDIQEIFLNAGLKEF